MEPDLNSYDRIIIAFSGGKDSLACLLHVLEAGADPSKVELWHHDVDGREGPGLMDWPVTPDYCRSVAQAFELPIYFSWKVGGFRREMLRENQRTAPTKFETPEGIQQVGGTRGKKSTRRKFPQVSADLSVRWCSAYLKIDVANAALRNDKRFRGIRTLFVTGERAEESAGRAKYATFEPHKADLRNGKRYTRHIDHWRPVHGWPEAQVWEIIERHQVNPHPAYVLGFGRVSCKTCIFASADQFASVQVIDPSAVDVLTGFEEEFDSTIKRGRSVPQLCEAGTPYEMDPEAVRVALSETYDLPVIVENWQLPAGAYGESCGPV